MVLARRDRVLVAFDEVATANGVLAADTGLKRTVVEPRLASGPRPGCPLS